MILKTDVEIEVSEMRSVPPPPNVGQLLYWEMNQVVTVRKRLCLRLNFYDGRPAPDVHPFWEDAK